MTARAVTALFDSQDEAAKVVDRIEAEGVPQSDISIVSRHAEGETGPAPEHRGVGRPGHATADGAGAGASVGTVLGGGAGLLASLGLLAIPGAGPVVAAGWLVAALSGAGIGAAAGGLIGALTGTGLSGAEAETYAEGIRRGGTLVTVRADCDLADRIIDVMKRGGAIDLDERAGGWRAQGWTGGTSGPPQAHATPALDPIPTLTPEPATPADPAASPPTRRPPTAIG